MSHIYDLEAKCLP